MRQFEIVGDGLKLILEGNVLAVLAEKPLNTLSSAIHNGGGLKQTKVIVNTQVTDEYGDRPLHENPEAFIVESYKKLGLEDSFVGMVTYAMIEDFVVVSKRSGDLGVSVIATAGCTHGESAGEPIEVQPIEGTINIMVIIDGNPCESCLASTIITATEAKTAALMELDIRSRWSGDKATGTMTDAMVVADTGKGPLIIYAGPASRLGQLVGYCTRKAVKEAVTKARIGGFMPNRPLMDRLRERHLSVERIAAEMAKVKSLGADEKAIANALCTVICDEPVFAALLLAAAKLNEDFDRGLVATQLSDLNELGMEFGELLAKRNLEGTKLTGVEVEAVELVPVCVPPFLKQVLVGMVKYALSKRKT
jgi:iron complex transport system ATP-binding protein